MDSFLPPVIALLLADVKGFKAGMVEARGEMAATNDSFARLGSIGKTAMLAIGAAALAVGAYSVDMAAKFDRAMELIHTQAGASQVEVEKLKNEVLNLAGPTAQAPIDLANGLYHIESAGFRGNVALQMLTEAAKGATIGQANLESVTQAMIGTMAAGLPDVHNAAEAMQYLNMIVGTGDMRMNKLAQSIATGVLPTFKTAGLTMKDYGAALATLTDNVTPADEAATRLRMTISLMAAPSGVAVKWLKTIGLSAVSLGLDMQKPDGLLVAIKDFKAHLEAVFPTSQEFVVTSEARNRVLAEFASMLNRSGSTAKQTASDVAALAAKFKIGASAGKEMNLELEKQVITRAFGGGRSSGAIQTLLVELPRLESKYQFLGTAAQRAAFMQESWAKTQEQFGVKMEQVKATVEALAIRLGEFLIPYVIKLADLFIAGVKWIEAHKVALVALGLAAGTILATGLVYATAAVIDFTIALVTDPVFLMVAAVVALGVGLYELWQHSEAFRTGITDTMQALQTVGVDSLHAFGAALSWVEDTAKAVGDWISSWLGPFVGWWQDHWNEIGAVARGVWAAISGVVEVAWNVVVLVTKTAFHILGPFITAGWDIIVGVFKIAWDAISTVVKVAWDIVSGVVRVAFEIVRGIFDTALALLTGHWGQAWHAITSTFSSVFGTIVDTAANVLSNLWHGIVAGTANFGTLLWNAGKDLIMGLINGIKALWGDVTQTASNIGSDVVNAVKNVFGIASPSRVFNDIGVNTMDAMAAGIHAAGQNAIAAAAAVSLQIQSIARATAVATYNDYMAAAGMGTSTPLGGGAPGARVNGNALAIAEGTKNYLPPLYTPPTGGGYVPSYGGGGGGSGGSGGGSGGASGRGHTALSHAHAAVHGKVDAHIAHLMHLAETGKADAHVLAVLHALHVGTAIPAAVKAGIIQGTREAFSTVIFPGSPLAGLHSFQALTMGAGSGISTGASSGAHVLAPIVVQIDGRTVFEAVQEQTLQYGQRNLTNGLTPATRR